MMPKMVIQEARRLAARPPVPQDVISPVRCGVMWLLLCAAVPALLLVSTSPNVAINIEELWPVVLLTAYSGTHLAIRFGRGDARIASTAFWLFVYVAMAVATLAQISTGLTTPLEDPNTMPEAVFITLIACVAYDLGRFARRQSPRTRMDGLRLRSIHFGRLNAIGFVGVVAATYYIQTVGLSNFFSSRTDVGLGVSQTLIANGSQAVSATVGALAIVPIVLAWLGWTARLSRDAAARRSPSCWSWYLILTSFVVILSNPISAPRNQVLTVALAAVFCLPNLTKRRMRFIIAGAIVLAITVFPYSDYFRLPAAERQPLQVNSIAVELASSGNYDQMTMTANGVWYAGIFGHTNGSQLLSDVLFFVPHTVWPGRATDTGTVIGNAMAAQNTNLSAPLWLEFWLDFSWLGLIAGLVLFGWISARWEDLFVYLRTRHFSRPAVIDLAVPLFAGYQFILVRGPLLADTGRMVAMAILLVLIRGRPMAGDDLSVTTEPPAG